MARLSVIDPDQLPLMQVLETLDSEAILDARMARLKVVWADSDPPAAAQYDVENLEFDPIKINQEVSTYFELLLRDRVNQAARSVTLVYATGGDLDAIASRYPGGVPRLALVDNPRPYALNPEDWEGDERYRLRIWLSPNTLSPHGVYEAYVFFALTADPTLRDVQATAIGGKADVYITLMADGTPLQSNGDGTFTAFPSPTPTKAQINLVAAYIADPGRKALTDVIHVLEPKKKTIDYEIDVWLYPGWDQTLLMTAIYEAMATLIEKQRWLGFSHTQAAVEAALKLQGVFNVNVVSPSADVIVPIDTVVVPRSIKINYKGRAGVPGLDT